MWSWWDLCTAPSTLGLVLSSASTIQAYFVLRFPILRWVSPLLFIGILRRIAAGIGTFNFLRAGLVVWECSDAGFRHSHSWGVRVILERCFPTTLSLLKILESALEKVVLGVQCLHGEDRAVHVVLRTVVDWKRGDVEEACKGMTWRNWWRILLGDFSVRACLWTDCIARHPRYGDVFSLYTLRRIIDTTIALQQILKNTSTMNEFQLCLEEFWKNECHEDEVCGRSPCCSLYHFHLVFRHNLHFFRIED